MAAFQALDNCMPDDSSRSMERISYAPMEENKIARSVQITIWDAEGKPPQSYFVRFASLPDRMRTTVLQQIACVDMVFVTIILLFDGSHELALCPQLRLADFALNLIYATLAIPCQLRTSIVDAHRRVEILDPAGIAVFLIMSPKFWIDILSCLFWWILLYSSRPVQFLALIRVLRGHHLTSNRGRLQSLSAGKTDSHILQLVQLFIMIYLIAHLSACVWFATVKYSHLPSDKPLHLRYLAAMRDGAFYLLGPKFMPTNRGHMMGELMETVAAPLSAVFTATVFGRIIVLVGRLGQSWSEHLDRIQNVQASLVSFGCNKNLCARITIYQAYLTAYGLDHVHANQLFAGLSPALRTEVKMNLFESLVTDAPFFQGMETRLLEKVILAFTEVVFSPGDVILRKGDIGEDMYFIIKGSCDVLLDIDGEIVAQRHVGEYFGEVALVLEAPRNAWVRAQSFCVIAKLTREVLHAILVFHPEEKKIMLEAIHSYGKTVLPGHSPEKVKLPVGSPLLELGLPMQRQVSPAASRDLSPEERSTAAASFLLGEHDEDSHHHPPTPRGSGSVEDRLGNIELALEGLTQNFEALERVITNGFLKMSQPGAEDEDIHDFR